MSIQRTLMFIAVDVAVLSAVASFSQDAQQQPAKPNQVPANLRQLLAQPQPLAKNYLEIATRRHATQIKTFQDEFEKAARLSVKQRLQLAADLTAELRKQALSLTEERLRRAGTAASPRIDVFPRQSHLVRLAAARPWCRDYWSLSRFARELWHATYKYVWPTEANHAELLKLTKDIDPDIQALAIEALATLRHPEDIHSIGRFLNSRIQVVPFVDRGSRRIVSAVAYARRGPPEPEDPVVTDQLWRSSQSMNYAQRALKLMTGHDFDKDSFWKWAGRDKPGRECLWYWQQRFQRQLDALDVEFYQPVGNETWQQWSARREQARSARCALVRLDLARTSPEVEAKVRLLAKPRNTGDADITEPALRFFERSEKLRLSADRLLQLIDGQDLWEDVAWETENGQFTGTNYNRIVERIGLAAELLFAPGDVERFKAVFAQHRKDLWWSGKTAGLRGISRLLPPAKPGQFDNPNTRDGWLRQAIRNERDVFVRGYLARELIQFGLADNWTFLKTKFFEEKQGSGILDLRQSIIIALRTPPLTRRKLDALVELIEDRRFHVLLTQPNRVMGQDMYRHHAIRSINAHAGEELISRRDLQLLSDKQRSAETLDSVLQRVRKLADEPRGQQGR